MAQQVFEGQGKVRSPWNSATNEKFFIGLKNKLGFKDNVELTQFYFVVGLIHSQKQNKPVEAQNHAMKEVCNIYSFPKKEFYDNIVVNYLDVKEGVRDEFETYQKIGMEFLQKWNDGAGQDCTSPLDRFCSIWDELGL